MSVKSNDQSIPRRLERSISGFGFALDLASRILKNGQPQTKAASTSLPCFVCHLAAMRPGHLPRKRQTQPGTLDAAIKRVMRAKELFKNLFFAPLRHAHSAIFDFQL